jgi:hypothetical protein
MLHLMFFCWLLLIKIVLKFQGSWPKSTSNGVHFGFLNNSPLCYWCDAMLLSHFSFLLQLFHINWQCVFLRPGASFQNRFYWDSNVLFWDTQLARWRGYKSCLGCFQVSRRVQGKNFLHTLDAFKSRVKLGCSSNHIQFKFFEKYFCSAKYLQNLKIWLLKNIYYLIFKFKFKFN